VQRYAIKIAIDHLLDRGLDPGRFIRRASVTNRNDSTDITSTVESAAAEGESPLTSLPDITDASKEAGGDSKCQITQPLEGGMSEILRSEDAIGVMTSVLLTAAKIQIQAGKFGFNMITVGTTTNIAEIRKYTEQSLVELPFEVATEKIAKTGAGCVGDGLTPQEKVATAKFIEMVGVGTSDENQRKCRLWWKDLSDPQNAGVVCTLLYRNAKFNKYCKTFPRRKHSLRELIDTVVSWEKVYCSHIEQIGLRALDHARGNYSGRLDLLYSSIAEILSIPESK
jgi:hypothetical protein